MQHINISTSPSPLTHSLPSPSSPLSSNALLLRIHCHYHLPHHIAAARQFLPQSRTQPSRHHQRSHQPLTRSLLLPSTINHQRAQRCCVQPLTSLPSPPTIDALNTVAVNHQRTHCRCHQPLTHSSLSSTIDTLIAVAANYRHRTHVIGSHQKANNGSHRAHVIARHLPPSSVFPPDGVLSFFFLLGGTATT